MDYRPLISVIVPVYKVEEYLPRCVESLLAQTYDNLEILLVDDGSPDRCGEICDDYAAGDSRIRVIHKPNGGLSDARNAGIEAATGEYLGFCDSDDWMEADAYESLLNLALREDVKLVCAGRYDVSGRTGARKQGLCPPKTEVISGEELVRRIFRWDQIDSAACDKLYHRSLFATIRYPIGKIVEDVPTTYRIALMAGRAAMLSKPVYNYYHRAGSITNSGISPKLFHYPAHTASIYEDICRNHPALKREAEYLRVRALGYTLTTLLRGGAQGKGTYPKEYQQLYKEFRSHRRFILTDVYSAGREKRDWLLLLLGLYRPAEIIYHILKKGME